MCCCIVLFSDMKLDSYPAFLILFHCSTSRKMINICTFNRRILGTSRPQFLGERIIFQLQRCILWRARVWKSPHCLLQEEEERRDALALDFSVKAQALLPSLPSSSSKGVQHSCFSKISVKETNCFEGSGFKTLFQIKNTWKFMKGHVYYTLYNFIFRKIPSTKGVLWLLPISDVESTCCNFFHFILLPRPVEVACRCRAHPILPNGQFVCFVLFCFVCLFICRFACFVCFFVCLMTLMTLMTL